MFILRLVSRSALRRNNDKSRAEGTMSHIRRKSCIDILANYAKLSRSALRLGDDKPETGIYYN